MTSLRFILLILLALPAFGQITGPSREAKPWTRWWWLGSGVDEANLTAQLEAFAAAGLGGVEICPIYGAKGFEDRDLPFLSAEWTAMLDHTSRECARLGLGLDLTTGTGWPFGGPSVSAGMASHSATFSDSGITPRSAIQKVKRAAPGGAGHVLDPFSPASLESYLSGFDAPLQSLSAPQPRAHFHDSFEYYGANWTPGLPAAFKSQHGYDLDDHLAALAGNGDPDTVSRVHHDYRETLDLLHRSYLETWHDWANRKGSLTRNQAHGSPGNLLDHYAVADIPETEIFRHVGEEQIPMLQFASSAAHVTGRNLVSAESFTWLGEHFQVKTAALKEAADFLWLGGVNHLFFHGIPYSPADASWPGWLFYASTHMGPEGGLWRDMPAFTGYITRVQTELQSGRADSSVLLYFPVHDLWSQPAEGLPLFTIHNQDQWLHPTDFYKAAMTMWNAGIPCDFVSDHLLGKATVKDGILQLGGSDFKTLVIPDLRYLPRQTAERLIRLADQGASIAFLGKLPEGTPGLPVQPLSLPDSLPRSVELLPHLESLAIQPEPMSARGLRFVRRRTDSGHAWFIVNRSDETLDAWIPLTTPFASALFLDPSRPGRSGSPRVRDQAIHFVLAPGESRILRTFTDPKSDAAPWSDRIPTGEASAIRGPWTIDFLEGGPELPASRSVPTAGSWTELADPACRRFSGTARYTTTFDFQEKGSHLLDLGEVAETCRITLNDRPVATSFFPPHRFDVTDFLKQGINTLEVEVTNLAANRIADLDRRKVNWKSFHEINFVNIDYQPFDASAWPALPSGLLGPVRLLPLEIPEAP